MRILHLLACALILGAVGASAQVESQVRPVTAPL